MIRKKPMWEEDDGEVFRCKLCRKYRPISLKSKKNMGACKLCMGGK